MKTKIMHKKGKKRSLSETSVSKVKLNKKQENVNEFNKSPKRAKIAGSKQNGNSALTGRTQIFKVDKQKKEQNKIIKQQSNIVKSETKKDTKETPKLTIVGPKNETIGKSSNRPRKRHSYRTITLTAEQITNKIVEIKNREVLSKRAHRVLGKLNRKLREIVSESEKLDTVGKKNKKIEHCANALMKNKQKVNDENKVKVEKKHVQSKSKQEEDENNSDIEEDEGKDSDIEEESDEDESDESEAENEFVNNKKSEIDNESDKETDEDEEEEIEEEGDTEDEEDVEDEEDIEDEENVEDEENIKDEEDEEDEEEDEKDEEEDEEDDEEDEADVAAENIIKKTRISEVRRKDVQNKNKQVPQSLDNQKKGEMNKKRYVLFVGNLPLNITEDEIKRHFLTKVGTITSIRIPTKSDKTPRGFAYVEMTNNIDFEKGLSLNHTFLKKKRINVQYSMPMNSKKADTTKRLVVAKNMKLQALRKVGKLADGNEKKKKFKKEK